MGLEKLTIIPLDAQMAPKGDPIKAMYNPAELTIDTKAQFQRTAMPGLPTPITQFVSGDTQSLSFDLFFDTYEAGEDVRIHTKKVVSLLNIERDLHAPPVCLFQWGGPLSGTMDAFKGVIDSCGQKFTMFLDSGVPVRATLSLSVSEYQTLDEQVTALKLQSADRTKRRVFTQGDSLWGLAYKEYNDVTQWRLIAEANDIDNPRRVSPGTVLTLPPLD